jgi:hypothetical protein
MTKAPFFDVTSDGQARRSIMGVWNWIRPIPSKTESKAMSKNVDTGREPKKVGKGMVRKDSKSPESRTRDTEGANGYGNVIETREPDLPSTQTVLLLNEIRTPYTLTPNYPIPELTRDDELLIKTQAIGLNPIDWKAPYVYSLPNQTGKPSTLKSLN